MRDDINALTLKPISVLPTLMYWRREVLEAVFGEKPSKRLLVANRQYYAAHVAAGSHFALQANWGGEPCGCGGICYYEELPSPDNPTGLCGYLMNIYVRKDYRDRGIAHSLVSRLIADARKRGCGKIYLETTPAGRPVYESLGFHYMEGMMILKDDKTV